MILARKRALTVGALLLTLAAGAPAVPEQQDRASKEQELGLLRQRIQALSEELTGVRGRRDDLADAVGAAEVEIGRLLRGIHELSLQIDEQEERLEELERQREVRRQALAEQRGTLAAQLRAAHIMGRQERIKILLNQQDPDMVTRMLVYYDYLNRERLREMQAIRDSLDQLHRLHEEIGQEQRRLRELLTRRQAESLEVRQAQQERERLLGALEAEIAAKGEDLAGLQRDEKQLEEFLLRLQRTLDEMPLDTAGGTAFEQAKGELPWPASGWLAVSFGSPRKPGSRRWDGILINADEGSEVRAVHHGRVAFADWLRGLGLLLIVDHGNGYMTLYGQNQSLFKETGDWVGPGELVGLVGRSGGHSSAGVYFGIRHQGKPLNPRNWCKPVRNRRVG